MYSVFQLYKPRAYPFSVLRLSTGSALTAAHFCQTATKVSKKALPPRTALASLKFPHYGPATWARRDGPSLAQHGSPGIHAGRPTPRNLLSASRRGGRSRSKSRSQADRKLRVRPAPLLREPWNRARMPHSINKDDGAWPMINAGRLLESRFYEGVQTAKHTSNPVDER